MRKVSFRQELVDNNIEVSVRHLKQFFKFGHGSNSFTTKAVHDVSFDIKKGECFGVVGESGCGKTTTGRSMIRLYDITSGSIYFEGYRISAGKRWNEKEITCRGKRSARTGQILLSGSRCLRLQTSDRPCHRRSGGRFQGRNACQQGCQQSCGCHQSRFGWPRPHVLGFRRAQPRMERHRPARRLLSPSDQGLLRHF